MSHGVKPVGPEPYRLWASWSALPARSLPFMVDRLRDELHNPRRSRITQKGYRAGCAPANKGRTFPPEPLSTEEVLRLLEACPSGKVGIRNRALVALLWRTGLRISEALDLRPHHVDYDTSRVTVLHGKGNKRRVVSIDAFGLAELTVWLAERERLNVPADAPLFCTVSLPKPGRRVHGAYVREMVRDLGRAAKIPKRCHPHGFRHSLACDLIREGYPLPYVQAQLGHASPGTTGIYLRGMGADEAFEKLAQRAMPGSGS